MKISSQAMLGLRPEVCNSVGAVMRIYNFSGLVCFWSESKIVLIDFFTELASIILSSNLVFTPSALTLYTSTFEGYRITCLGSFRKEREIFLISCIAVALL